jgi:DNA-binding HxlR family transcriptional regulator
MTRWKLVSNFEKSKATQMIVTLLDKNSMNFTELMRATKSNPRTLSDRIKDLSNNKIISVKKLPKFPFTETIELTEDGKEIAKRMKIVYSHSEKGISKRAKQLLYVIYEAGEKIVGTTRMEKLPFILEKEFEMRFNYHYKPMNYGPYSIELLDEIDALQREGYIEISEEFVPVKTEDGSTKETERRSYILTKKGIELGKNLKSKVPPIEQKTLNFIKKYNQLSLNSLLDFVHGKYPTYKKDIKN